MTEDEKKMQEWLDHIQGQVDACEKFEGRKLTTVETIVLAFMMLREAGF